MSDNLIYELRVVCRNGDEQKYPFEISTAAKYYYTEFADAEAAVLRLVGEYAEKDWVKVYQYGIYTYRFDAEITDPNRDSVDAVIYLPDGARWNHNGVEGVLHSGELYECIVGNMVDVAILHDETPDEFGQYKLLKLCSDYNIDHRHVGEIMPCSLSVSEVDVETMKLKLEVYEEVEHNLITPEFGLPYTATTMCEEDMNDYLYIPASLSGYRYDMFFDCKAAYKKNMHPMWFYVAYPDGNKRVLLPITVSDDITLIWVEYEDLMYYLSITEGLIDFVSFNLREIMRLADRACSPDHFLWNMMRMNTISKFYRSLNTPLKEL